MLFFYEEYRFTSKLLKRQRQLQEAFQRARAIGLADGLIAVYAAALAAHEAVLHQFTRLADVVVTSFGDEQQAAGDDTYADHKQRVAALVTDIEAFERQATAGSSGDIAVAMRRQELERRRLDLDSERLGMLRNVGVRTGMAHVFDKLYRELRDEVLDFDMSATRKRLGLDAVDTGFKAGADVVLPGTGVLRDLADMFDRYFDGHMVDDEKAQDHHLWLDTYRRAADDWAGRVDGLLRFVPGVPP